MTWCGHCHRRRLTRRAVRSGSPTNAMSGDTRDHRLSIPVSAVLGHIDRRPGEKGRCRDIGVDEQGRSSGVTPCRSAGYARPPGALRRCRSSGEGVHRRLQTGAKKDHGGGAQRAAGPSLHRSPAPGAPGWVLPHGLGGPMPAAAGRRRGRVQVVLTGGGRERCSRGGSSGWAAGEAGGEEAGGRLYEGHRSRATPRRRGSRHHLIVSPIIGACGVALA